MDEALVKQLLDQLFPTLEALDAQSAGLLAFSKDEGLATDERLAACLDQASKASNLRWRATQVRIEHQLSAAFQAVEEQRPNPSGKKPKRRSLHQPQPKRKM